MFLVLVLKQDLLESVEVSGCKSYPANKCSWYQPYEGQGTALQWVGVS